MIKLKITSSFIVESLAGLFTLAGIYIGSTTKPGAMLYLIATICWCILVYMKKMWGLLPLNIITFVILINVLRG